MTYLHKNTNKPVPLYSSNTYINFVEQSYLRQIPLVSPNHRCHSYEVQLYLHNDYIFNTVASGIGGRFRGWSSLRCNGETQRAGLQLVHQLWCGYTTDDGVCNRECADVNK